MISLLLISFMSLKSQGYHSYHTARKSTLECALGYDEYLTRASQGYHSYHTARKSTLECALGYDEYLTRASRSNTGNNGEDTSDSYGGGGGSGDDNANSGGQAGGRSCIRLNGEDILTAGGGNYHSFISLIQSLD